MDTADTFSDKPHKMVVLRVLSAVITGAGRRLKQQGTSPWQLVHWTFHLEVFVLQQTDASICGFAAIFHAALFLMRATTADHAKYGTARHLADFRRNLLGWVVGSQNIANFERAIAFEKGDGDAAVTYDPAQDVDGRSVVVDDLQHGKWKHTSRGKGLVTSSWAVPGEVFGRVEGDVVSLEELTRRLGSPPVDWKEGYALQLHDVDSGAHCLDSSMWLDGGRLATRTCRASTANSACLHLSNCVYYPAKFEGGHTLLLVVDPARADPLPPGTELLAHYPLPTAAQGATAQLALAACSVPGCDWGGNFLTTQLMVEHDPTELVMSGGASEPVEKQSGANKQRAALEPSVSTSTRPLRELAGTKVHPDSPPRTQANDSKQPAQGGAGKGGAGKRGRKPAQGGAVRGGTVKRSRKGAE